LRDADRHDERYTFAEIEARAAELTRSALRTEPVLAKVKVKDNGGHRVLTVGGWKRRSIQILLRDILLASGIGNEFEYSKRNLGPLILAERIRMAIERGYRFWFVSDLRNCFPSQKPAHYDWANVPGWMVRYVAFTPACVPVLCRDPSGLTEHDLESAARRGLPQGAMASPLLASALLGRVLRNLSGDIVATSFGDDIAIGARTLRGAESIAKALTKRLAELPAGPLSLKTSDVFDAEHVIEFLHFRWRWKYGFGDPKIHREPSRKAFNTFERRLAALIEAFPPGTDFEHIVDMGLKYARSWATSVGWPPAGSSEAHREAVDDYLENKVRVMTYDILEDRLPSSVAGRIYGIEGKFTPIRLD
jgi:hypothetical protein